MQKQQMTISSPLGALHLVGTNLALHGIYWQKLTLPMATKPDGAWQVLNAVALQLTEYFAGTRKTFDVTLSVTGTTFQQQVWQQLQQIPYGETRSYRDIAQAVKNPKACRAVGTANGRNVFPIIVPCHRVIAADGTLGGFAWGLKAKRLLLDLEQKL